MWVHIVCNIGYQITSLDKCNDETVVNGGKWVYPYLQKSTFEPRHEIYNNVTF